MFLQREEKTGKQYYDKTRNTETKTIWLRVIKLLLVEIHRSILHSLTGSIVVLLRPTHLKFWINIGTRFLPDKTQRCRVVLCKGPFSPCTRVVIVERNTIPKASRIMRENVFPYGLLGKLRDPILWWLQVILRQSNRAHDLNSPKCCTKCSKTAPSTSGTAILFPGSRTDWPSRCTTETT